MRLNKFISETGRAHGARPIAFGSGGARLGQQRDRRALGTQVQPGDTVSIDGKSNT